MPLANQLYFTYASIFFLFILQIILVRFFRVTVVKGFLFAFLGTGTLLALLLLNCSIQETFLALIHFSALSYCYFHFINIGESSVRIRILYEINTAPDASLSKDEIYSSYSAKDILGSRFQRLKADGHIREENGLLYLHRSFLLPFAKLFQLLKLVFIGRRSL